MPRVVQLLLLLPRSMGGSLLPLTRLNCDAFDGLDTGAGVVAFAAFVVRSRNAIVAKFTPPPPPDSSLSKYDTLEPRAHLLREVTA